MRLFDNNHKPIEIVLAEARAKLDMIAGQTGNDEVFSRITAEELARANFDMTYLVGG